MKHPVIAVFSVLMALGSTWGRGGEAHAHEHDAAGPSPPAVDAQSHHEPSEHPDEIPTITIGLGLGIGVAYLPEMSGLSRRIEQNGHGALNSFAPTFSLNFPITVDRVVFHASVRNVQLDSDDATSRYRGTQGLFVAGYSITNPEVLALYPFLGLGVSAARLTVGGPIDGASGFDAVTTSGGGPLELASFGMIGAAGIGTELQFVGVEGHPTRGLYVSARFGVTASFFNTDWTSEISRDSVSDGPTAALGSYFGELGMGVRF